MINNPYVANPPDAGGSGSVNPVGTPVVVGNLVMFNTADGTEIADSGLNVSDIQDLNTGGFNDGANDVVVFTRLISFSTFQLKFINSSNENQLRLDYTIAGGDSFGITLGSNESIGNGFIANEEAIRQLLAVAATGNTFFTTDGLVEAAQALDTDGDSQQGSFVVQDSSTYIKVGVDVKRADGEFFWTYSIFEASK